MQPLNGTNGFIDVKLRQAIHLTAFTLEHIPSSIAYEIQSAPYEIEFSALSSKGSVPISLGNFSYSIETGADPVQTFYLHTTQAIVTDKVRLNVLSNHGNKNWTCVYRLRVHGEPVKP